MAMRLYHRRSSASRERLQALGLTPAAALRLQILGTNASNQPGATRQRSLSLFPGSEGVECLSVPVPPRSRSHSFSGPSGRPGEGLKRMTSTEEENVFRCYARIMYVILGGMAATVILLVLYGLRSLAHTQLQ